MTRLYIFITFFIITIDKYCEPKSELNLINEGNSKNIHVKKREKRSTFPIVPDQFARYEYSPKIGVYSFTPPPEYQYQEKPSPFHSKPSFQYNNQKPTLHNMDEDSNSIFQSSKDNLDNMLFNSKGTEQLYIEPDNPSVIYKEEIPKNSINTYNGQDHLPKRINLREPSDNQLAQTNKNPIYGSKIQNYDLQSVKELPLSDYMLKFQTLNSYNVPHYFVTSNNNKIRPQTNINTRAKQINDNMSVNNNEGNIKTVGIWSHKSIGTSYTLNDDGTLSLENR